MNLLEIEEELQKIKRTTFGISIPELRRFAKKLAKKDCGLFLKKLPFNTFEQRLLGAYAIGYIKADINLLLDYFEKFMPYVDRWEINDALCQNFKIAREHKKIVWDFLMKYKNSKEEFHSRIVSVMLLSHFLDDEYIEKVLFVLGELNTEAYYSKMGVAWAVATVMGKYPNLCFEYLKIENCPLADYTRKKALQKIKESYRVSEKIKKNLANI